MTRRLGAVLLGLVLVLSVSVGVGLPAGVLADTTYTTCPSFSTFKTDVEAVSGTATISFTAPNCVLSADSTIATQAGSTVTIDGNGLTVSGGTAGSPGHFDLFDVGNPGGSLMLDHVTVEYGQIGIGCGIGGCDDGVSLYDSTVRGNSLGGVALGDAGITNSTVTGNGEAGVNSYHLILKDSTISGNGGDGVDSVTLIVTSSSIFGNSGVGLAVVNSPTTIMATILAGNSLGNCAVTSPITDQGYNRSTDATCGFSATGSQNSVSLTDLKLGTLGDYGGPTQTIPLLPGSSAIDAIPLTSGNCSVGETYDQRTVTRPQGTGCDIGAFEALAFTTGLGTYDASAAATDASVTLNETVNASCPQLVSPCPVVNEGTVTFAVTDKNSNPVGTNVSGNVANGSASADFVPTGLAVGRYTITATFHDPNGLFADNTGTATLTITAGPPAQISLDPGDTSLPVGTQVTETATVKDQYGNLVKDGTNVQFSVTGTYTTAGSMTTYNGQAHFSYTGQLIGQDTLTATAQGGTNPSTSATITWTAPASTAYSQLSLVNVFPSHVMAYVLTGSPGSGPIGLFSYRDSKVALSRVHLQSLVVNGNEGILYGTAELADHTSVTFRLDATGTVFNGTYRLQLSNGYDSGIQHAWIVAVR